MQLYNTKCTAGARQNSCVAWFPEEILNFVSQVVLLLISWWRNLVMNLAKGPVTGMHETILPVIKANFLAVIHGRELRSVSLESISHSPFC